MSPNSSFNFLMRTEDIQSLQRHRSTSTPNVHMISTLDPGAALLMEVREHGQQVVGPNSFEKA